MSLRLKPGKEKNNLFLTNIKVSDDTILCTNLGQKQIYLTKVKLQWSIDG